MRLERSPLTRCNCGSETNYTGKDSEVRTLVLIATVLGYTAIGFTAPAMAQHVPGAPTIDWEREQQEYRLDVLRSYNQVMKEWREAWERGDAQAALRFYADGAYLFVSDQDLIEGRESIHRYLQTTLPNVIEIRTGLSDFVASDRLAYALGPFWFQYRDNSNGVRSVSGTFVAVLVRQGRQWKIRSQVFKSHSNSESTDG